jgi:hypothetical protein
MMYLYLYLHINQLVFKIQAQRCFLLSRNGISNYYGLRVGLRGSNPAEASFSLFPTMFRPVLGHTQPTIQWVPETIPLKVKRQEREADH